MGEPRVQAGPRLSHSACRSPQPRPRAVSPQPVPPITGCRRAFSPQPAPASFQFAGVAPAKGLTDHAVLYPPVVIPLAPAWSALQPPSSLPEPLRLSGFMTALLARDACGRLEP